MLVQASGMGMDGWGVPSEAVGVQFGEEEVEVAEDGEDDDGYWALDFVAGLVAAQDKRDQRQRQARHYEDCQREVAELAVEQQEDDQQGDDGGQRQR